MKAAKPPIIIFILFIAFIGCKLKDGDDSKAPRAYTFESDKWREARSMMVDDQLKSRDIADRAVLEAMRKVPRHMFVPKSLEDESYGDYPLPIGEGQTISQPYIVAKMTELMQIDSTSKVLEVGTGSGYQAAVLSEIVREVYSIEIVPSLGESAARRLEEMKYENVHVKVGDGYRGWPEEAPFDAIIVTAAPPYIPPPLVEQLKMGGRLVLPVGSSYQELLVVKRTPKGIITKKVFPVRFVPMTGEVNEKGKEK